MLAQPDEAGFHRCFTSIPISPAASVVFARKPDGPRRIRYDYQGLNAITEPRVEPIPHIDALLDETRGAKWFTKFDLAQSYHQVRICEADWWKTSYR